MDLFPNLGRVSSTTWNIGCLRTTIQWSCLDLQSWRRSIKRSQKNCSVFSNWNVWLFVHAGNFVGSLELAKVHTDRDEGARAVMLCIYKRHTLEQRHGSGMNGKGNIWIAHDPLATGVPPIPWPTSPERPANPHTHIICHWSTHQTDSNLRTPTAIIHLPFLFTSQPINVSRTSPNLGRISVSLSGTNMTRHEEPF